MSGGGTETLGIDQRSGSTCDPAEGLTSSISGHPSWIGPGGVTRGSISWTRRFRVDQASLPGG